MPAGLARRGRGEPVPRGAGHGLGLGLGRAGRADLTGQHGIRADQLRPPAIRRYEVYW